MRTTNNSQIIDGKTYYYTVRYPDLWATAYNPQYLELEITGELTSYVVVTVGDKSIEASLYKGKSKIYIDRMMQLCFDNISKEREKEITYNITFQGVEIFQASSFVLWGQVKSTDSFYGFGKFKYSPDDSYRATHQRRVAWFKNFPFAVTTFFPSTEEATGITVSAVDGRTTNIYPFRRTFTDFIAGVTTFPQSPVTIASVYYAADLKRFIGKGSNGQYYDAWSQTPEGSSMASSEAYNHGYMYAGEYVTRPLNGVQWEQGNKVYVYDSAHEQLIEDESASQKKRGLVEMIPATAAPDAMKWLKYSVLWDNANSDLFNKLFQYTALQSGLLPDSFDQTFDQTFHQDTSKSAILLQEIQVEVRNDTKGYYLRWLDRFGFMQYYLFEPGEDSTKTEVSKYYLDQRKTYGDIEYAGHLRPLRVTTKREIKVCAVNLDQDYREYVGSIVESPVVDLYQGNKLTGRERWIPVHVANGTFVDSPKTLLQDLEITIVLPDVESQTL